MSVIARWSIDNASTGLMSGTLVDDTGNANTLTVDNTNSDGNWTSVGAGNGFTANVAAQTSGSMICELVDISTNGNIGSLLANATQATMRMVVDLDASASNSDSLFHIGTYSGNGDFTLLVNTSYVEVRWDRENTGGWVRYPIPATGVVVIDIVVDTSQATAADRVKLFYSDVQQTNTAGTFPTQNMALTSVNNTNRYMALFNRPTQNRNASGSMYYAELHDVALTPTQITDGVTALLANNDADWSIPTLTADSITAAPIYAGTTVTIDLSNATNAAGKTLSIPQGALTATSQDINSISFLAPDLKTFGDKTGDYSSNITVTVTDGAESSTIDFQVLPDVGDESGAITAVEGIYADAAFTGVVATDLYYTTTITDADFTVGAVPVLVTEQVFSLWIQDQTDGVWGSAFTVTIPASVASGDIPVITLSGDNPQTVEAGTSWSEPGYSATDTEDGTITGSVVVAGDTVDVGTLGAYVITYNVTDSDSNPAVQKTRTVNVTDTIIPVVTLIGTSVKEVLLNGTYVELGATATDSFEGTLTGSIVTAGDTVDETTLGSYVITYDVSDSSGNDAVTRTRTVNVVAELSVIPPASRTSVFHIAAALRALETYTHNQTNELVVEWLESEGVSRSNLNVMLYGYLGGLGYAGTMNERLKAWSDDV